MMLPDREPDTEPVADPAAAASVVPPWGARLRAAWSCRSGALLRLLVALLPLLWLIRSVDFAAVLRSAGRVRAADWLAALGSTLAGIVLASLRWRVLARCYGAHRLPGMLAMTRHYLVGCYYALLPTGIPGDIARGYRVQSALPNLGTSYLVVLIDRAAGLVGLLMIAVAAMAFGPASARTAAMHVLDVALVGCLFAGLLLLAVPRLLEAGPKRRELVARIPLLGAVMLRIPPPRSWSALVIATGLSVLVQAFAIAATYWLARPVAAQADLAACARALPFIFLLIYVPLTPAGIGQREMLFAYFFGMVGVPVAAALVIAWLNFSVSLATAAIGGACLLAETTRTDHC